MSKFVRIALSAWLALFAIGAHAQEEIAFYAGAGIGNVSLAVDPINFDQSGMGFKVFGGALFNPYFGMEASIWDSSKMEQTQGTRVNELGLSAFTVQVLGGYPFGEYATVYGKLGVGFYRLAVKAQLPQMLKDGNESGSELSYGIGVSARVWRGIQARLEWEMLPFDIESIDGDSSMISLSGAYKF